MLPGGDTYMERIQWIGKTDTPHQDWGPLHEQLLKIEKNTEQYPDPEEKEILFRREITVRGGLRHASLLICGLGYYRLHINGQELDSYVLAPLETGYRERVLFDRYDVTTRMTKGENAIGVELGNARYSPAKEFWDWRAAWYGDPCLALRLTLSYEDGHEEILSTDTDWRCCYGPIVKNCFYHGEHYDARLEKTGWTRAGYDDSDWQTALPVDGPEGEPQENTYFHLVKRRTLKPVCRYDHGDGRTVFDFEENIAGWVRIKVKGACGSVVSIRHAECLEEGELNCISNRRAMNTDRYILGDAPVQEYEPKFTLHGFRAVEVSVEEGEAELLDIEAYAVWADIAQNGFFESDCEELNRLHDVILRTQQAALMSCSYDCPQRDERLGWLGDAHVTADTCLYNFDMRLYYDKWLEDMRIGAHPKTGAIPHIVPWHHYAHAVDFSAGYAIILWKNYCFHHDPSLLEKHCDALIKYVDYLGTLGPILEKTRYGDWMSLTEGWVRGDPACSSSLFYYYALTILIKVLTVLHRDEEKARFTAITEAERAAILSRFYDAEGKGFDDNTQFSLAFALMLGLIPAEDEQAVLARLVDDIHAHDDHLTTGIFGTKFLMSALEAYGRYDVIMRLLLQRTYPSWLNMIEGRTTLPERWDGGMAAKGKSQNHCMLGSVDSILYSVLGGIRVLDDRIAINPYAAKELGHVRAKANIAGGSVTVEWKRTPEGIVLDVDVCNLGDVFYGDRHLTPGHHSFIL